MSVNKTYWLINLNALLSLYFVNKTYYHFFKNFYAKMSIIKTSFLFIFVFCVLCKCQEIDVGSIIPSNYDQNILPTNYNGILQKNDKLCLIKNTFRNVRSCCFTLCKRIFRSNWSKPGKHFFYINKYWQNFKSFQADIFLLQEWTDFRLANNEMKMNQTLVLTQPEGISQIWRPDLYFVNSRNVKQINSLETVEKMTIDNEGNIAYMLRLSATFKCPLNLLNYPHDWHNCPIKMSSSKN